MLDHFPFGTWVKGPERLTRDSLAAIAKANPRQLNTGCFSVADLGGRC